MKIRCDKGYYDNVEDLYCCYEHGDEYSEVWIKLALDDGEEVNTEKKKVTLSNAKLAIMVYEKACLLCYCGRAKFEYIDLDIMLANAFVIFKMKLSELKAILWKV